MPSTSDGGDKPPASTATTASDSNNTRRRGRRDRRGNDRVSSNARRSSQPKFEGREPSLKGFIYDSTGERNPDQYIRTTKEIINYVGRTYTKYTAELTQAVRDLVLTDPMAPVNPDPANVIAFELWKIEIKEHRMKQQEYANFKAGLYNVVLGQCTDALQDKLKSHADFPKAYQNGISLLTIIKTLTYTFEEQRKLADALCDIKEMFYSFRQGKHMSLQRYYELFLGQVEVCDEVGVSIADESLVESLAASNGRAGFPTDRDLEEAREQALAIRFIRGANDQHKSYLTHLRNSYLDGSDYYPATLHDAYNKLQRREPEGGHATVVSHEPELAFVTAGGGQPRDITPQRQVICYECREPGHIASNCPRRNEPKDGKKHTEGTSLCMHGSEDNTNAGGGFSFSQSIAQSIPTKWILLDNQSTVDLFCNSRLLRNIRRSDTHMIVRCNAGQRTTDMIGDLPGYGTVWYDPRSIANILSLRRVAAKYHVAYDSHDNGSFVVTKPDGTVFEFQASEGGLYYLDTENTATVLVNTVADNKAKYTNDDYLKAVAARELQIKIGRPSTKQFIHIVTSNQLPNCPITKADIVAAEHIFGPDVGSLKGKTVRRRPHLARTNVEPLPPQIMSRYRNVTLAADLMYVNGIPMLVTISNNIRFGTVEALPNRNFGTLVKGIKSVASVYRKGGFRIITAKMDGEFEALRGELADLEIGLNEAARDEHVGEVERYIRTLKERMRAIYSSLPFSNVPPRLVIEMAKHAVYWLNAFPCHNGVSGTLSPRTIITGQTVDYNRHCRYGFGEYVQTHEQHDNTMAPRTIGALALRPTGNAQGNFYFFSLSTGRIINRAMQRSFLCLRM